LHNNIFFNNINIEQSLKKTVLLVDLNVGPDLGNQTTWYNKDSKSNDEYVPVYFMVARRVTKKRVSLCLGP